MADYAWSTILTEDGTVAPGETVTRDKLKVSKDEYEDLKAAGAIRELRYPKDLGPSESPREANLRKLNEAIAAASEDAYSNIDFTDTGELETAAPAPGTDTG